MKISKRIFVTILNRYLSDDVCDAYQYDEAADVSVDLKVPRVLGRGRSRLPFGRVWKSMRHVGPHTWELHEKDVSNKLKPLFAAAPKSLPALAKLIPGIIKSIQVRDNHPCSRVGGLFTQHQTTNLNDKISSSISSQASDRGARCFQPLHRSAQRPAIDKRTRRRPISRGPRRFAGYAQRRDRGRTWCGAATARRESGRCGGRLRGAVVDEINFPRALRSSEREERSARGKLIS